MLTKKERMEKLNNAGVNVGKYFTLDVGESIPAGAKIHVIIDDRGNPVIKAEKENNDAIYEQIIEDGYVKNTRLFRRWVMAQMFSNLNYVSYDGYHRGYNDCIKRMYSYDYTLSMMTEEIRVLSKLETKDKESFDERSEFFNKNVVIAVLEDYLEKLKAYINKIPNKNCKGIPYKRIKSANIFVEDLDKKLYSPVRGYIFRIKYAKNYTEIYRALEAFARDKIKLPYETPKSKVWVDTFKGEGAYYTLKNLVMYHHCLFYNDIHYPMYGNTTGHMNFLKSKLTEYQGEGWRMFALMNKVIEDNNINTATYIGEICNK